MAACDKMIDRNNRRFALIMARTRISFSSVLVILFISILLISILAGCNKESKQETNMIVQNPSDKIANNDDISVVKEHENVTNESSDNTESDIQNDEGETLAEYGSQVNVVLKTIELHEDNDSMTILITPFESSIDYIDKFEIEYNTDYYELSIFNSYQGLPEDSILVNPRRISRIAGSKFIKQWYKTGVLGDHNDRWNISFYKPIKYSVEELSDPYQYKIMIKESDENRIPKYIVRSKSGTLGYAMRHLEEVDYRYFKDLGREANISILKDENGFFCTIESFKDKVEAETLMIQLEELIEENGNTNADYSLKIEKRD